MSSMVLQSLPTGFNPDAEIENETTDVAFTAAVRLEVQIVRTLLTDFGEDRCDFIGLLCLHSLQMVWGFDDMLC